MVIDESDWNKTAMSMFRVVPKSILCEKPVCWSADRFTGNCALCDKVERCIKPEALSAQLSIREAKLVTLQAMVRALRTEIKKRKQK